MSDIPLVFPGTGAIQSYIVPVTGSYVIEASGAQGGNGRGPGGKGARLRGIFDLKEGEVIQIVVGLEGKSGSSSPDPAGGGGGGSFVWKGVKPLPLPSMPMLAAGGGGGGPGNNGVITMNTEGGIALSGLCGYGGSTDFVDFHYSGGGGAGWRSNGAMGSSPTHCNGGSRWTGGHSADYAGHHGGTGGFGGGGGGSVVGYGSGGGGGYSGGDGGSEHGPGGGGGGSYNGGTDQTNFPGIQTGDGCVSIALIVIAACSRRLKGSSAPVIGQGRSTRSAGEIHSRKTAIESVFLVRCV